MDSLLSIENHVLRIADTALAPVVTAAKKQLVLSADANRGCAQGENRFSDLPLDLAMQFVKSSAVLYT